jgi:hypothetical protein
VGGQYFGRRCRHSSVLYVCKYFVLPVHTGFIATALSGQLEAKLNKYCSGQFSTLSFLSVPPYIQYTGGRNQFELTQPIVVLWCAPQRNKQKEAHTLLVSFYFSPPPPPPLSPISLYRQAVQL